jgi:hypothetical protein
VTQAHYLCTEKPRVLAEFEKRRYLDEYLDVLHGADLITAFQDGCIGDDDIVLMFLIDGARYQRASKAIARNVP